MLIKPVNMKYMPSPAHDCGGAGKLKYCLLRKSELKKQKNVTLSYDHIDLIDGTWATDACCCQCTYILMYCYLVHTYFYSFSFWFLTSFGLIV